MLMEADNLVQRLGARRVESPPASIELYRFRRSGELSLVHQSVLDSFSREGYRSGFVVKLVLHKAAFRTVV
jgi:hypothetical protein